MLRLAGSLKLGMVQAASIMKTLRIDDRPTKLAQAVAELGRIDKTIHALTYIADESKRRRTLTQLNRGEDRHKLARAVSHGKRGELRQRYREGQEDQLGALGLVVNIIILWNTLYINAAMDQLAGEGYSIRPEDVARLSPLVFEHINLLGRYGFSAPDSVLRGQLRPLRNPARRFRGRRLKPVVHGICKTRVTLTRFSVPLIPNTLYGPRGTRHNRVESAG